MQLISKFNKGFNFFKCVIAWVISLKNKKRITKPKAFQKILDE